MSIVPIEPNLRPFVVKPAGSPLGVNEALSKNMKYLTENDHTLIMSKAKPLTFAKGEPLIREGTPSPAFYMIRSGNVRVQRGSVHALAVWPERLRGVAERCAAHADARAGAGLRRALPTRAMRFGAVGMRDPPARPAAPGLQDASLSPRRDKSAY